MAAGVKVKYGEYVTGKVDRDKKKRIKNTILAASIMSVVGSSIATQYMAHALNYPRTGVFPFEVAEIKIYPPNFCINWLIRLISQYGIDNPSVLELLCITLGLILFTALLPVLVYKSKEKARQNREKLEALHGSARWADIEDIREAGLMAPAGQSKTGAYVGGFDDPKDVKGSLINNIKMLFGKEKEPNVLYLKHDGPEHILAFAPTRSGKGVGLVLPTLLNWPHSTLVLDVKGENYKLSSGWRKKYAGKDGNYILQFNPIDTSGKSARYNPLNEIRLGTDYEHADIENLAMLLADPTGKGAEGSNSHWVNTSTSLLICLIYDMMFMCTASGEEPTLEMLRTLFTAAAPDEFDKPEDQQQQDASEEAADAFKEQTLKPIFDGTHVHNPNVNVTAIKDDEIRYQCKKIMDGELVKKYPTLYEWRYDVSGLTEEQIDALCKCDNVDPINNDFKNDRRFKIYERQDGDEKYYAYYTRFNFNGDEYYEPGSSTVPSKEYLTPKRTHPKAAENANEAYQRNSKEAGSVLSTAANALKLYADPTVSRNLKNATFRLYDLMNADKPCSLYLFTPPAQLSRLAPIMRIIVTQVITILADKLRYDKTGQAKGNYQHRMLLMLDEFPTLGNMESFETISPKRVFVKDYGMCQKWLSPILSPFFGVAEVSAG